MKGKSPEENAMDMGMPKSEAEVYYLLAARRKPLAQALEQRDPKYAASLFKLCDVLQLQAERQARNHPAPPHKLGDEAGFGSEELQWPPPRSSALLFSLLLLSLSLCCLSSLFSHCLTREIESDHFGFIF